MRAAEGRQDGLHCLPGDYARHSAHAVRGDYSEADLCFSWCYAYFPVCKPCLGFYTLYKGRQARKQERESIKAERETEAATQERERDRRLGLLD